MTLLTNPGYLPGVKALYNSLVEVESDYILVVLVTPYVADSICDDLASHGCLVRVVELQPPPLGLAQYASPRFMECWTKLRVWELVEFERLVREHSPLKVDV